MQRQAYGPYFLARKPREKKVPFGMRSYAASAAALILTGIIAPQSALAAERTETTTGSSSQPCPAPIQLPVMGLKMVDECLLDGDTRVQLSNTSKYKVVVLVRTALGKVDSVKKVASPDASNNVAAQLEQPIDNAEFRPNTMYAYTPIGAKNPTGTESRIPPGWAVTFTFPTGDTKPLGHRISVALDTQATAKYLAGFGIAQLAAGKLKKASGVTIDPGKLAACVQHVNTFAWPETTPADQSAPATGTESLTSESTALAGDIASLGKAIYQAHQCHEAWEKLVYPDKPEGLTAKLFHSIEGEIKQAASDFFTKSRSNFKKAVGLDGIPEAA